jgi:sugar phosphate isomerase/epimerase
MDEDPLEIKDILNRYGVAASGLSAHCPLMRPEVSVPYLQKAIRFAAAMGAPVVNTDEGIRPPWVPLDDAYSVIRYTLSAVLRTAERYNVRIGIEPHQSLSKTTSGLLKIAALVPSPCLRINYDTGNAYLGGEDPYEGLSAVLPLLTHVHAKDISFRQAEEEKGKTTGTPVGCACGDGVIDWAKVITILRDAGFDGVLSVECGTPDQARRSREHLESLLAADPSISRLARA